MILVRDEQEGLLSIPRHREMDAGTLRGIIGSSGMTVEEFVSLLKE